MSARLPVPGEVWPSKFPVIRAARVLGVCDDPLRDRPVVTFGYVDHHALMAQPLDDFTAHYVPPSTDSDPAGVKL